MFMMARIYLIFRVLAVFSIFNAKYVDRLNVKEINFDISYRLIMKTLLKQRPYTMLLVCFISTSTILAVMVRLFERPFYDDPVISNISEDDPNYQDYSLYNNSWWAVVVTMTTIGYGDYFPVTHLGRIVIVIACFSGVFIVSLTVVTLTISSEFSYGEKSTYEILQRLRIMKTLDKYSKRVIYYNIRSFYLRKKIKKDKMNVNYWTELRSVQENKKLYENLFRK